MHCPNCGTKNIARAKFCVKCGEALPELKKRGAAAAAPAPAVQQIVIKQKTNWLNVIFGILLLAILFCVGSVFLMDATDASAATVQQMIADPQLYFDNLGRLADQFVTGAKVVLANIGGDDNNQNGGQANACPRFSADTAVQEYVDPNQNTAELAVEYGDLGFGNTGINFDQPGLIDSKVSYTPINDDNATPGKSYECSLHLGLQDNNGNPLFGEYDDGNLGFYCGKVPYEDMPRHVDRYVLSYKTDTCSESFIGIGGGQLAAVANPPGTSGNNAELCNEAFYQPPTFQSINWLPADTLNFNVSLPVLFGGEDNPQTNAIDNYPPNTPLDEWMVANDLEIGDLANLVRLDVSGTQFQYCNVDSEGGDPFAYAGDPDIPHSEDYERGLNLTCAVTTDREITDYELANVELFAFGCPLPLAIDRFSIPPKDLQVYTPPEDDVTCKPGEHLNHKGECVPNNDSSQEVGGSCNSGDVMDHVGQCCSPSTYDSYYDSCNPPFYTP